MFSDCFSTFDPRFLHSIFLFSYLKIDSFFIQYLIQPQFLLPLLLPDAPQSVRGLSPRCTPPPFPSMSLQETTTKYDKIRQGTNPYIKAGQSNSIG